jgi:probable HAF family extracellular repeat protein
MKTSKHPSSSTERAILTAFLLAAGCWGGSNRPGSHRGNTSIMASNYRDLGNGILLKVVGSDVALGARSELAGAEQPMMVSLSDGSTSDLPLFADGADDKPVHASGLNASGVVVGAALPSSPVLSAGLAGNQPVAVSFACSAWRTLFASTGAARPHGINDAGVVVGQLNLVQDLSAMTPGPDPTSVLPLTTHAFATVNGQPQDLHQTVSLGGRFSVAWAVSSKGQVVGDATLAAPNEDRTQAFLYDTFTGQLTRLGTLGGPTSSAYAISDLGLVVGDSITATGETHAFLYSSASGMKDLGTLGGAESHAFDLSSTDPPIVVGISKDATGMTRAFTYVDGAMTDLTPASDLGRKWDHAEARSVSRDGSVVVGYGVANITKPASTRMLIWSSP